MPLPEGPVVDAKHAWRCCLADGCAADRAEQGGWTGRHPEPAHEPSPRLTQTEGQQPNHLGETDGSASERRHHGGESFREDPTRAGRLAAEELANAEVELDRPTPHLARAVGTHSGYIVVNRPR